MGTPEYWRWTQQAARVFERHLTSEPFTYTLDLSTVPPLGPGMDPVESFLFVGQRGHCEYYASAMAALCQSVEINARIVTGYIGSEFDEDLGAYVIRDSNAHAWIEVRSAGYRWATFDPTPAADGVEAELYDRSLTDRLRWMYERVEFAWNSNVVAYNQSSQERLATRFDFQWGDRINNLVTSTKEAAASLNRTFYLATPVTRGSDWSG